MMGSDEEKLALFYQLSKAVSFISDPAGLERHFSELLKKLISCNSALVFHNNLSQKSLTAGNPYNLSQSDSDSVTISHDEVFIADLLVRQKSVTRLNPQKPVLPMMRSELMVPLLSPHDILGCLYVSRLHPNAFQTNEIQFIEHAAVHLAFALERQQYQRHLRHLEESAFHWQDKYIAFLQAIPYAAAIVDRRLDHFDEVNDAALELFGCAHDDFIEKPFSWACTLTGARANGDKLQASIVTGDAGQPIECLAAETIFMEGDERKSLFVFTPLPETPVDWMVRLARLCVDVAFSDDVFADLTEIVRLLSSQFDAAFIMLQTFHQGNRLEPLAAFEIAEEIRRPSKKNLKDLQLPFIESAAQENRALYIEDVRNDAALTNSFDAFERLNCRALAVLPLTREGQATGCMTLFARCATDWQKKLPFIETATALLASTLLRRGMRAELAEQNRRFEVLRRLNELGMNVLPTKEFMLTLANELRCEFVFDYISMSLFDDGPSSAGSMILCTEALQPFLDPDSQWSAGEGNELGWVTSTQPSRKKLKSGKEPNSRLPFSLPVHFSSLLLHQKAYIGNLSFGRLSAPDFSESERRLIKELSGFIAAVASSNRQVNSVANSRPGTSHAHDFFRMEAVLSSGDVLSGLRTAIPQFLNVDHFALQKVESSLPAGDFYNFIPENRRRFLSNGKLKEVFKALEQTREALCVSSSREFVDLFCDQSAEELTDEFQPFVLAPIFQQQSLYAFFVFDWPYDENLSDYQKLIIKPLTDYVETALRKEQLFKDLQAQKQELEHLLTGCAHDLKTPVQNLRSFMMMLADDYGAYLPEEPQKYLLRVLANIDDIEKMVMDFLQFYRAGKLHEFAPVNVQEVVKTACSNLTFWVEKHHLRLLLPSFWPTVQANPTALLQIFNNLLTNAAKAAVKNSQPVVELGFLEQPEFYEFFVRNNGPSIPSALHEKIFELFFKGSEKEEKSTGMGLAIVKRAVQMHGGQIRVESAQEGGATFRFTLPKTVPRRSKTEITRVL